MSESLLKEISDAIIEGNGEKLVRIVEKAIRTGLSVDKIVKDGITEGATEIGKKYENKEVYLPELIMAGEAMKMVLVQVLRPMLSKNNSEYLKKDTVILGTAYGDVHDIGKNLVGLMLEGSGFNVIDLGVNVPAEKYVEAAIENRAKIVAISALITTTMLNMKEVIESFKNKNYRNKVKIILGGAPLDEKFSKEIGADGYAEDAVKAIYKVKELLNK